MTFVLESELGFGLGWPVQAMACRCGEDLMGRSPGPTSMNDDRGLEGKSDKECCLSK
jgi:hypothetical protein